MNLEKINKTIGGHYVKDLRYLPLDNIIVGLVLCPIFGKPTLFDGYVSIQWNKKGVPIKKYKGASNYSIIIN